VEERTGQAAVEGVGKYIATRVGRRPSCSGAHKSRIGIPWRTRGRAMEVASPTWSWESDRERNKSPIEVDTGGMTGTRERTIQLAAKRVTERR
jgi:hypothetical protein